MPKLLAMLPMYRDSKRTKTAAKTEQSKAKLNFDEMIKWHNSRINSLSETFDTTFRSNKTKKEHCHGGKHNGVHCIKIMEKADLLFQSFMTSIKEKSAADVSDTTIEWKCLQCARLLGSLDAIWSNVRGIDAGLPPTTGQIQHLTDAMTEAKRLWLDMDIGNAQSKWHLTFDGHLLQQVIKHGWLADKSDDTIEFQHQMLMKPRDRCRSVTSYQPREICIRRQLRRMKSPETQAHVDQCEASIKVKTTNKRAVTATELQEEQREAKRVKREAVLHG